MDGLTRTRRLVLLALLLAGPAGAENLALEAFEVIGTRSQAGNGIDSAVPVDVFTGEDLRATGAVGNELGEALAVLVPSFNFPRQSNSVTSDHVRSAQLRGMSPDQVLVLVNGQRRHVSAVVNDNTKIGRGTNAFDFNTIPLSAVERVEILRDGASAQYGSDAIAGVINIVLSADPDGHRAGARYGAHRSRVAPLDRTVTDGNTATGWLSLGHRLADDGFIRYGVEATTRGATNRAGFDRVSPFIPQTEANLAFQGQQTHRVGDPETDALGAWINARQPLETATIYANATFSHRETEGAAVFRHPDTNQNVRAVFPEGFRPVTEGENRDYSVTAGVDHQRGGWRLDHALTVGNNRFEFGVRNSLNPSLGPDSPTRFDSGRFEFDQINLANEATRHFDDALFGRDVRVAAGAEYRFERFRSRPGEPASFAAGEFRFEPGLAAEVGFPDIGAQGAKGLTPDDAARQSRHVAGVFGEASVDLSERLETTAAARLERYSDFGTTLTGKLAGRYRIDGNFAARASVSSSFRAPSLAQIGWGRRDNTFSAEGGRISSRLLRSGSPLAASLELAELSEETAVSASAGLVFESDFGLGASLDIFEIRVDDAITQTDFLGDSGLIDFIQAQPGGEGVESVAFFANAVDTRTRGIETMVDYQRALAGGLLRLDSAWTWTRSEIRSVASPPGRLAELAPGIDLLGVGQRNTIETATPRHAWITTGRWRGERIELTARTRAFSSVVREFDFARQRFSAQWALDAEAGYALTPDWTVTAGASNLLDNYPDESENANDFFGNFAFDPINPIGLNGRFFYLRTVVGF